MKEDNTVKNFQRPHRLKGRQGVRAEIFLDGWTHLNGLKNVHDHIEKSF